MIGTGSPNPLPERQGAAVLLSRDREHLLFGAGRGVTTQLICAGVAPHQLSAVFLTHHHYDYIGNLGDLLRDSAGPLYLGEDLMALAVVITTDIFTALTEAEQQAVATAAHHYGAFLGLSVMLV